MKTIVNFDERLEKAVQRGRHANEKLAQEEQQRALSEEELRRLHTQYRLELSEQIEKCVAKLSDHFPGFRFERTSGEKGWGACVSRDDVDLASGGRRNLYSRLEMAIRPFTSYHALELTAKGTVRNKEVYNRTHFQRLAEASSEDFAELIDLWVLEYAELYARST